jgi:hypothetical protein
MKALGEGVADQLDAVVHLQLAVVFWTWFWTVRCKMNSYAAMSL